MSKISKIICVVVFSVSILFSLFVLYTPIPSSSASGFSAVAAASYIKEISLAPHSMYDEENHEDVRLYLKDKLESFVGSENVVEMNYTAEEASTDYDVKDLLGVIQGQSDSGILLVAHYDSRGHVGRTGELGGSYGAADDGYGLAVLLEVARLYGDRTDLKNSIYILITDAEETGLDGARMAATDSALMEKIGFVINVEARGVEGAAYMFETSTNNEKVIDFYKNANLPVSYSIATAVYTVMPNLTDFTEFLALDKQGVNFAVLDSLYYYHTPRDNYTNINQSSIQHYGEQIVPLVDEFVNNTVYSDTSYFVGDQNQVFFTLVPNVFVAYRDGLAVILHLVTILLILGLFVFLSFQKMIKPLAVVKYLGVILATITVVAIAGLYISKLIAWLGKTPWKLVYVRMEGSELPTLGLIVLLTVGLGYLFRHFIKNKNEVTSFLIAGIFLNSVFANVTGIVLSGASFLFFLPSLFGIIVLLIHLYSSNKIVSHLGYSITQLILLLVLVPLLYSLFLALTVGGLLALFVILVFYLIILIPVFLNQFYLDKA
jgi:hypothetical protein